MVYVIMYRYGAVVIASTFTSPTLTLLLRYSLLFLDRVEITGRNRNELVLHPKPGKRQVKLIYAIGTSVRETQTVVTLWAGALKKIISHWGDYTSPERAQVPSSVSSGDLSSIHEPISPSDSSVIATKRDRPIALSNIRTASR